MDGLIVRIAYFINRYPAGSHTFIRQEICALEVLGETVIRYALLPGSNLLGADDIEEKRRATF